MKVLYNSLDTSKALFNNNVKKNTSSTTTDCKSFHHNNVIIDINDFKRMEFDDFNLYCTIKIHGKKEYNAFEIEELSVHKKSRPTTLKRFKKLSNLGLSSIRYTEAEIGYTSKISLNILEAPKIFIAINPIIIFDINLSEKEKFYLAHIINNKKEFIDNKKFIDEMCRRLDITRETFIPILRKFDALQYLNFEENRRDKNNKFLPPKITILSKSYAFKNVEKTVENHVDNISDNLKENSDSALTLSIIDTKVIDKLPNIVLGSNEPKTLLKNCFKELKKKLNEGIYQNWIATSNFEINNNQLIITTLSKFHKEWIESKYKDLITRIFNKIYNINFSLEWKINKDLLPNKELKVANKTGNIQLNVVCLDKKRNYYNTMEYYAKNLRNNNKFKNDLRRKAFKEIFIPRGYNEISDVTDNWLERLADKFASQKGKNSKGNLRPGEFFIKGYGNYINTFIKLVEIETMNYDKEFFMKTA